MPVRKSQEEKSENTIRLQPQEITDKIEAIMLMDIAGYGTGDIAKAIGLTVGRVSIIKHTPLYEQQKAERKKSVNLKFDDKHTDKLVHGDPVTQLLKGEALNSVKELLEIRDNAHSEFARMHASTNILDRAGYKAREDKTIVSVQVTEKMADRFESALKISRMSS